MRLLALDASRGVCSVAFIRDGHVVAEEQRIASRGQALVLIDLATSVLAKGGRPDRMAVITGPGSFTGLRAAIALAQGLASGFGVELQGVGVADALRSRLASDAWVALRGDGTRVFLDRRGLCESCLWDAVPKPDSPTGLLGDAAVELAARHPGTGWSPWPHEAVHARDAWFALRDGHAMAATPIYVDPPPAISRS